MRIVSTPPRNGRSMPLSTQLTFHIIFYMQSLYLHEIYLLSITTPSDRKSKTQKPDRQGNEYLQNVQQTIKKDRKRDRQQKREQNNRKADSQSRQADRICGFASLTSRHIEIVHAERPYVSYIKKKPGQKMVPDLRNQSAEIPR